MQQMTEGCLCLFCRYKPKDYILAVALTAGVMLFFLTGQVSSVQAKTDSRTALAWGTFLMLGYLGFDGFTSTFQDSLFKGYSMSTYNQMLYVNAFSSLVSLFGEPAPLSRDVFCSMHTCMCQIVCCPAGCMRCLPFFGHPIW